MLSIEEAEIEIGKGVRQLSAERVFLSAAQGRILRQSITSPRAMPPFDRVMMDGVGVRLEDWRIGIKRYKVVGMAAAGEPRKSLRAEAASCLEVMTGAICPEGVSVVIPREQLKWEGDFVEVDPSFKGNEGQYIHRKSSDGAAGEQLLDPGTRLDPRAIAVAASCGLREVLVSKQPRMGIVSSGNELIEPGEVIAEHQIYRSNAYALEAIFREKGFRDVEQVHFPDDLEAIRVGLKGLLERVDVLVLSGGVSMGRFDYIPRALESAGVEKRFHRVAQRPGKPMWMGQGVSGQIVFGLPGNPVSTVVGAVRYVLPALEKMMGSKPVVQRRVRLAQAVEGNPALGLFIPVCCGDSGQAIPVLPQNSGDFYGITGTDGFIELAPKEGWFEAGFEATFFPW